MAKSRHVGGVIVDLIARTTEWTKGFVRAKREQDQFTSKVKLAASTIAKYAAGYLAVREITRAFNDQRRSIDRLAKTSDKLGIPTKRLSQMQYAATLSGVEVRKLDMGLQRMTRRLAEVSVGTGEARSAVRELGLDISKISTLTPDEQFLAIADAMEKVSSQSDKVRLSFKLFDSEGVDLVNLLNKGSDGLREMYTEADRLGISVSRLAAAKVEQANDALRKLGYVGEGLARTLVVELSPIITKLATDLTEWATSGDRASSKIISAMEYVHRAFAHIMNAIDLLKASWFGIAAVGNAVASGWVTAFGKFIWVIAEVGHGMDLLIGDWLNVKAQIIQGAVDVQAMIYNTFGTGGTALAEMIESANEAAGEYALHLKKIEFGVGTIAAPLRKFTAEIDNTAAKLKQNAEDNAIKATEAYDRVYSGERLTEIQDWYNELQSIADNAASASVSSHEQSETKKLEISERIQKWKEKAQWSYLQSTTAALASESKEWFRINKLVNIAETTMNTISAMQLAYKELGPIAGAVAATAIGIAGAARVNAIRQTTFEGGGSIPGASGGDVGTQAATQASVNRTLNLTVVGNRFSREDLINIGSGLGELAGDGFNFNVRNA